MITLVRTNYKNFRLSKSKILAMLVLRLVGGQFNSIPVEDRTDICQKMGIQVSLVSKMEYREALLKTTWEDLAQDYRGLVKNLRAVADIVE